MRSHELARELLSIDDKPISVSVDISSGDNDAGLRVFADEYHGPCDIDADNLVLLFCGTLNK